MHVYTQTIAIGPNRPIEVTYAVRRLHLYHGGPHISEHCTSQRACDRGTAIHNNDTS
jgi:hypothetical protein